MLFNFLTACVGSVSVLLFSCLCNLSRSSLFTVYLVWRELKGCISSDLESLHLCHWLMRLSVYSCWHHIQFLSSALYSWNTHIVHLSFYLKSPCKLHLLVFWNIKPVWFKMKQALNVHSLNNLLVVYHLGMLDIAELFSVFYTSLCVLFYCILQIVMFLAFCRLWTSFVHHFSSLSSGERGGTPWTFHLSQSQRLQTPQRKWSEPRLKLGTFFLFWDSGQCTQISSQLLHTQAQT